MNDLKHDLTSTAWRGAPAVAVSAAEVAGTIDLNDWVLIATLVWILAQLGYLIFKWVKEWRAGRAA